MIKSSENKGDNSDSSGYYVKNSKNPNITHYFESARRISVEEENDEDVPKIEVSLNECFNKKKSQASESKKRINEFNPQKTKPIKDFGKTNSKDAVSKSGTNKNKQKISDNTSLTLNHVTEEISGLMSNNLEDEESIPNQILYGKSMPNSSKNKFTKSNGCKTGFKNNSKYKARESSGLVKTNDKSITSKKKKENTQPTDSSAKSLSKKCKKAGRKEQAINEKHK